MKIFDCKELYDLAKKVVNKKLIDERTDTFIRKSCSTLHFLSYDEIIEVCAVLDTYTSICNTSFNNEHDALYCFTYGVYDKEDFMAIAGESFSINDYSGSDYTIRVIFDNEHDEDDNWHSIFFVREFWEFCENCENFMNKNKNESGENMNKEITEAEEETFSIKDIYKIITDSEGFEKIIEGMEDIGFTDETIYEVVLNLVKRLN